MDAIVLATDARAKVRIAGLTARERGIRVARRCGAKRITVVDTLGDLANVPPCDALLVLRCDQLVHTPLAAPLIASLPNLDDDGLAIAVGEDGEYAGALLATGARVTAVIEQLKVGEPSLEGAVSVRHGAIARHAIGTREERRDAHRMLYQILVKPQDNAITRYLYRPVSLPLTRLLVWTPVTPNQVSAAVAVIVAIGCWLTARASATSALVGTIVVLAASYLDCCDGEIARVKLTFSNLGAWLDTVIDELSSIAYIAALGWHCHLAYGGPLHDPWIPLTIAGMITNTWSMYCVYFNIIVGVGSANSQDYAGRFTLVPTSAPDTVRLAPVAQAIAPKADRPAVIEWLATYMPYVVRRDFLSWMAVVLAALHVAHVLFGILTLGAFIMAIVLTADHVWLRRLRRSVEREGKRMLPAR